MKILKKKPAFQFSSKLKTVALSMMMAVLSLPFSALVGQTQEKGDGAIRALVEDLVVVNVVNDIAPAPLSIAEKMAEQHNSDIEYKRRFEKCRRAFKKLTALKEQAFPVLVEHLNDKRPSIGFGKQFTDSSVGDACYANIYFQFVDIPPPDPKFNTFRIGRDGRLHARPYWKGTPFDGSGGLVEWLEENKELTHGGMRIKCLTWLLEREKEIGACNAESYFTNILPIEITILEIRTESGENTEKELERLRDVLTNKDTSGIPKKLLPPRAEPE